MAGTTWTTFVAGTKAKASEVNNNFDWLEGHLYPQAGGSTTTGVYDLGSNSAKWRDLYVNQYFIFGSVTLTAANFGRVDDSTLAASTTVIFIKAGGVGTTQLTAGAVTDAKVTDVAASKITGTKSPSFISPQGSGSGLDADSVDGFGGTLLLALAISL